MTLEQAREIAGQMAKVLMRLPGEHRKEGLAIAILFDATAPNAHAVTVPTAELEALRKDAARAVELEKRIETILNPLPTHEYLLKVVDGRGAQHAKWTPIALPSGSDEYDAEEIIRAHACLGYWGFSFNLRRIGDTK